MGMITNLFSIFDPSARIGGRINWISMAIGVLIYPISKYRINSRWLNLRISISKRLLKEIKLLLPYSSLRAVLVFISLFIFIILNNRLGLVPYIFTATRHLVITLRVALPLWLGYFRYGWVVKTKWILAHLVPQGTPAVLIPFIVLIERVRSLIRPGTLSVRLAANIIAGHLLLTLIRRSIRIFNSSIGVRVILAQVILVILEVAVAFVQSYVLVILRVLYLREI